MVILPLTLLILAGLSMPLVLRTPMHHQRTQAISNAKQVGLAMLEFEQDYGAFPSDSTVAEVERVTGSKLDFRDGSSNAMFRQLIAYGVGSEDIFFSSHPEGGKKRPDGVMTGPRALSEGEVGFSYLHGLDSSMDPDTPLLMTPMKSSGSGRFWNSSQYGGKAVILRVDNSAEASLIRAGDDQVTIGGGVTLLDRTRPCFGGKLPDVRHPEFKP